MQVTRKVSETINRGVTAVAMTVAIATIYGAMAAKAPVSQGDILQHQIQTAFKLPNWRTVQEGPASQESLTVVVVGTHGKTYGHR